MPTLNIVIAVSNLFSAVLCVGLAVPLVRRRIKMNPLYGICIPRAFESDDLWYRINEYGGRRLIVWSWIIGVIAIVGLFVPLQGNFWLTWTFGLAPMLYLVPCVEAYRFAQRS